LRYSLYYPSIEFRDVDFLKKSLLVWDRVFRIVPPTYDPSDPSSIREAVSEGLVVDLNVDEHEKSKAAKGFLDFYHLRRGISSLTWPAGLDCPSFVRIDPEKIEARLLPLFEQLSMHYAGDRFFHVPPDLAGGYMFYLANSVAKRRDLQLITDSPDTWVVGSYFAHAGNFNEQVYQDNGDAFLCNLAITDLLPDRLDDVSMEDVIRFVEKHRDERVAFQDELERFRMELSRCNNKEHAYYIVNDFVGRLQRAKEDYRKAIAPFSKREICSIFSGGLSATLGLLSLPMTGVGDPYDPVRLGVGLLIGAVSALATRELIPIDKGGASYLISLEHLSSTPSFQLHRKFEEFIND
jgi:hypothetical protein